MRIESGFVGMESARSAYTVTVAASEGLNARRADRQGSNNLLGAFGNLLHGWANGNALGNERENLSSLTYTNKGTLAVSDAGDDTPERKLQKLREKCVMYLLELLFGIKSDNCEETADLTGSLPQGSDIPNGNSFFYGRSFSYFHEEYEETSFETTGMVKCSDGREISFGLSLEMSRSFSEYYERTYPSNPLQNFCDPLVINYNGTLPSLSDQKFYFDLDQDGKEEHISSLDYGSGFLALDKNGDGKINDGSELFGTGSGDGFRDLAAYDSDGDGWIDEDDAIWDKLKIWTKDEKGRDVLYTLKDAGVGAICLQNVSTPFSLNSQKDNHTNGQIARTGVFLFEDGRCGTVQHLDLAK